MIRKESSRGSAACSRCGLRAPGWDCGKTRCPNPRENTTDVRTMERLLTRGNKLAVLAGQALARVSAGNGDSIERDDAWRLSCDLRSWAADVRAVASEQHGDDDA
jgi:hypothetical protein